MLQFHLLKTALPSCAVTQHRHVCEPCDLAVSFIEESYVEQVNAIWIK